MKELQYRTFSLRTHKKNWRNKKPNVCQFELTFGCQLHCEHCYTDCYNKPEELKKELNTQGVKFILDKARMAGVIWLCFTGGDPLTRADFLDIYSYAKNKGFIIMLFTNAYSMSREIAGYLRKKPPFVLEMTLNAVTKERYEKISRVKGSFEKVMQGIGLILKAKLALKIKTQITKSNLNEITEIKKFIAGLGLKFLPSYDLHARLNGDLTPCNLRSSPSELFGINGDNETMPDCDYQTANAKHQTPNTKHLTPQTELFRCAVGGGDGIQIDAYGRTFLCNLIRKPAFNLLKVDIADAIDRLLPLARDRKFTTFSKCDGCNLRQNCHWCPGRAYVEKGHMEQPIEYYCELARAVKNEI